MHALQGIGWKQRLICLLQAYQTVKGDKKRYQERIDEIASRPHKAATKEPAATIQSEPAGEWFGGYHIITVLSCIIEKLHDRQ